jgi:hypothetical protein
VHVKVDLAYKVAYLVDNRGEVQLAQSGTSTSNVAGALASWGYAYTPGSVWECVDILNAIDAVQRPVQPMGT